MEILDKMMPRILDGYCSNSTQPREVAEAEANEFIKIIEDASAYMFGYNHSVAYCLIGYMCAYLRYYHPFEFITCYLNNASNDDDIKNGTALAEEYGIRITPPRYGVSRGTYSFNADEITIAKGMASIKYLGTSLAEEIMQIYENKHPETFLELLFDLKETSINCKQMDILIKIDFFEKFGCQRELFKILEMFDYFKQGDCKCIKRADLQGTEFESVVAKYTTSTRKDGQPAASYKFESSENVRSCMEEWSHIIINKHLPDIELKVKIQNSLDILGYADVVTHKEEDRRRLLITDVFAAKDKSGNIWGYRIGTRSIGSGRSARVTIKSKLFDTKPLRVGSIIYATSLYKSEKGYWNIIEYNIEP